MVLAITTVGAVTAFSGCSAAPDKKEAATVVERAGVQRAKFEPDSGKVLLFVGQELEAIGGTDRFHNGYYDHFPAPAGFTQYTSFLTVKNPADPSKELRGLDGVTDFADWGDGPENMSLPLSDPDYRNSCLAIGLDISQGNDSATSVGLKDSLIYQLGNWLKGLGERPVFLRIGYEFNGHEWNHYKKEFYVPAFRRIRQKLDSMQVKNVAYVWQSKGAGTTRQELDDFYPGDAYVDWMAYSYFIPADSVNPILDFARVHGKPVFIAESSPVFLDSLGVCKPLDLSKDADVAWAWKDWFEPYFRTVRNNADVIRAIHYINAPWKLRPLWKDNIYFKNIDARITENEKMKSLWLQETGDDRYLKASDSLFRYLYGRP